LHTPAFEKEKSLPKFSKRVFVALQPSLTSLLGQAALQKVENRWLPLLLQAITLCAFATVQLNANHKVSWKKAECNAKLPLLYGRGQVKQLTQTMTKHHCATLDHAGR
jgi:hypothetical protein